MPVIPVVHGTDASVAWKISRTGFSALSSLDAGFYGVGMYFTSSALYALPYYAPKNHPAILLCLTVPGNPLPVVENRNESGGFYGKPLRSGYQSHLSSPRKADPIQIIRDSKVFNEIVIAHESQVVPFAIVDLDGEKLDSLAAEFERKIP